jgi:hypothetical protein
MEQNRRMQAQATPNEVSGGVIAVFSVVNAPFSTGWNQLKMGMLAESEGFEPSDPVTQIGSLANYWFQPLTHDSARPGL